MDYRFHAVKEDAQSQALAQYGLQKEAVDTDYLKRLGSRLFSWRDPRGEGLKAIPGFVGEMTRDYIFGSPISELKRFRKLRSFYGGSTLKTIPRYWAASMFRKPLSWGKKWYPTSARGVFEGGLQFLPLAFTGHELYNAATTEDPEARKGNIAAALAGVAAAPVTMNLGLAGAALHPMLQNAARNLVQKKVAPAPQAQPQLNPVVPALGVGRHISQSVGPEALSRIDYNPSM